MFSTARRAAWNVYTEQGQRTKPVTKTQKRSLQTDFQGRVKTSLFVRKLSDSHQQHKDILKWFQIKLWGRRSNITGANTDQRCTNQHFTFFYFISQSAASVAKTPPQQRPLHIRHVTMDAGRPENGWFYKCKRKPLEEPGHQFGPVEVGTERDEVRQKKERNSRLTGGWRINQKNKDLTGRTGKRWGEKTGLDEIQEADLCGRVRKPPLIKMCQQGKVQREYPTNRAP